MGNLHAQEFRNLLGRQQRLQAHLAGNFYPPLPTKVKEDITTAFEDHWNGRQPIGKVFSDRCHLRSVEALCRLFQDFLDIEDGETY